MSSAGLLRLKEWAAGRPSGGGEPPSPKVEGPAPPPPAAEAASESVGLPGGQGEEATDESGEMQQLSIPPVPAVRKLSAPSEPASVPTSLPA